MRRKLAAGNWKMNGLGDALAELRALAATPAPQNTDILVCPPATLLSRASDIVKGTGVAIGGQDCHARPDTCRLGQRRPVALIPARRPVERCVRHVDAPGR